MGHGLARIWPVTGLFSYGNIAFSQPSPWLTTMPLPHSRSGDITGAPGVPCRTSAISSRTLAHWPGAEGEDIDACRSASRGSGSAEIQCLYAVITQVGRIEILRAGDWESCVGAADYSRFASGSQSSGGSKKNYPPQPMWLRGQGRNLISRSHFKP